MKRMDAGEQRLQEGAPKRREGPLGWEARQLLHSCHMHNWMCHSRWYAGTNTCFKFVRRTKTYVRRTCLRT